MRKYVKTKDGLRTRIIVDVWLSQQEVDAAERWASDIHTTLEELVSLQAWQAILDHTVAGG